MRPTLADHSSSMIYSSKSIFPVAHGQGPPLKIRVSDPHYEWVIPRVDIGLDEVGNHGIDAIHKHNLDPHYVELMPDSHRPVNVLSY
ncbi:hypothetical protein AMTR_s00050p00214640 [Amborella trichopoda]|uniref:Uncharacterized protein n=1 Tax=Amborella trichopoda TaxID=13333 RepID=W1PYB0_AMBTC|nr:hypothetical protein AMTR_s00050p00214640 [Amborella trichopoda]